MSVRPSSRRERNKQAVRIRINRATVRLIQARGIDSVTVENICQKADIARMTFYNYYASRHELLTEICRAELLDPVSVYIEKALEGGAPLCDQIEQLLQWAKVGFRQHGPLQRELIVYLIDHVSSDQNNDTNQLDFFTVTLDHFYGCHETSIKQGLTRRFCAVATVASMVGVLLNWLNFEDYPIDDRLDTLTGFFVDSFIKVE